MTPNKQKEVMAFCMIFILCSLCHAKGFVLVLASEAPESLMKASNDLYE